jgi:hypothetical protein
MSQRNYLKQLPFKKIINLKRFTNFLTNSQPELKQWLINNDLTIIDAYLEIIPKNVQSNIRNIKFVANNGVTYNFTITKKLGLLK